MPLAEGGCHRQHVYRVERRLKKKDMKNIFKKISAIAASTLMVGMTIAVAAAVQNYPAPFVVGGSSDVAIVYGTGAGVDPSDLVQANAIESDLSSSLGTTGGTPSGDNVILSKSSDNLNLQDTWGTFTGAVTDDHLSTLLADGTYIADDNDEFDYEQKINLGTPQLTHFRDSDYESLVGLSERTPVVGFKVSSSTYILNYTIDFLSDVSSDVDSNNRMEDIEGSDLLLMGKTYYVSEFHNSSSATAAYFDQAILLDSAEIGHVKEGETTTVAGKQVSIDWIDADEVVFMVDGERAPASGKLMTGNSYKLNDGSYIGVRDITKLAVSGEVGGASFSIGTGKLDITHGSDIKLNDDTISGIKAYLHKTSNKLDKIVIEWKTDEEEFVSPQSELTMPGFGALKFSMNDLKRSTEEKIVVEKDGDSSIQITMPIKDGTVNFNILYANSTGAFLDTGKDTDERFASTNMSEVHFFEKKGGSDYHSYFIATYNISKECESYLLRAKVTQDTTAGRNETTIEKYTSSGWSTACPEKANGDVCDISSVSLNIGAINYTSGGDEVVNISAGSDVNFHTACTPGGLYVYLPFSNNFTGDAWHPGGSGTNSTLVPGAFTANDSADSNGHSWNSVILLMVGEDKDETLGAGTMFGFLLDENSDDNVHVSALNTTGGNGSITTGSGGEHGLEVGDTNVYEAYVRDEGAPRILHYTQPDEDHAEVYYASGDSETYAEVFLTEESSVLEGGISVLGEVLVKDTDVSSASTKNLIVVGGSCINSAAATLVGGAKCTEDWTAATDAGSGKFLIQSFGASAQSLTSKVALLVAGYSKDDTINAVTYLRTQSVDTTAGKKYIGTSGTSASLVVS